MGVVELAKDLAREDVLDLVLDFVQQDVKISVQEDASGALVGAEDTVSELLLRATLDVQDVLTAVMAVVVVTAQVTVVVILTFQPLEEHGKLTITRLLPV